MTKTDDQLRELARQKWYSDGEIEIDDGATVSRGEEPISGAYVQAWVWVECAEGDDDDQD